MFSFQPVEVNSNVYTEPVVKYEKHLSLYLEQVASWVFTCHNGKSQELFRVRSLLAFLKHDAKDVNILMCGELNWNLVKLYISAKQLT